MQSPSYKNLRIDEQTKFVCPYNLGLNAQSNRTSTKAHALVVAAGILLSRLVGLVRDRVFAHYFGNSDAADAFRAAFRIPNFLQNLFGEGVLSASFIPVYARLNAEERHEEAAQLAEAIFAILLFITTQVYLWDLITIRFARVLDLHAYAEATLGGFVDMERRILKCGVAQAVAKWKERLNLLMIEPAIAHIYTFAVGGLMVDSLAGAFGITGIRCRIVLQTLRPGHWEAARWIRLSEQDFGFGPATLIARPPHFQNCLHSVDPR